MPTEPRDILDYWVGHTDISPDAFEPFQKRWYINDPEVDEEIRKRFLATLESAEQGQLESWKATPEGAVALIILFDQFSRNLYRGSADVYRNDARALEVAKHVLQQGWLDSLNIPCQTMVFHPFLHAEDIDAQKQCVSLFENQHASVDEHWRELVESHLKFVRGHASIVEQFGRFPHRNQQLGRESTPEEAEFLAKDSRSYGQGNA